MICRERWHRASHGAWLLRTCCWMLVGIQGLAGCRRGAMLEHDPPSHAHPAAVVSDRQPTVAIVGAAPPVAVEAQLCELLARWLAAVRAQDFAAYRATLHRVALGRDEQGSRGALRFFADELAQLEREGFRDGFTLELRDHTARAFLVLGEQTVGEHLVLAEEQGSWRVLSILPQPLPPPHR